MMASLTQTAYYARNIIKYGGVFVVMLVVVWMGSVAAIKAYRAAHPPKVAPECRYGPLKKMVFPEKQYEKKTFAFGFPNDTPPTFVDKVKVYFIYRSNNVILNLEKDRRVAQALGFVEKEKEISPGIYEFTNSTTNQTLTMNVLDGSFKLEYPYQNDQMLLAPESLPDKTMAISIAKSYLSKADKLSPEIEEGQQKVTFWKISYDGLQAVTSQSDANAVRVDFSRKNLDDYEIVSSNFGSSPISILISGSSVASKRVIGVNYKMVNIDRESYSTYPIKKIDEAMADLEAGNYWPISDISATNVLIKKVSLAYYEPFTLAQYLQPIYVFEGNDNFVAYVPAVTDEWLK